MCFSNEDCCQTEFTTENEWTANGLQKNSCHFEVGDTNISFFCLARYDDGDVYELLREGKVAFDF